MKILFNVKNWDQFQHYKDRNPPWIKLHNHLLDDYDFEELPDNTKCHLLCIWMLASRTNNEMVYDPSWVKRKIGANSTVDLDLLRSAGFIEVQGELHDASTSLVSVEKSREETEQSRVDNTSADRFSEFWDVYGKKVDSTKCKAKFAKLTATELDLLFAKLHLYIQSTPDKQYRKNPLTWLNGKCWNDEIQQPSTSRPNGLTKVDFDNTDWAKDLKLRD